MVAVSPYATALALNRPAPAHVSEGTFNVDRIRAYQTYEDVWNNVPEAFAALLRSGDDPLARRYIPAVRSLIEATNRYLALDMQTTYEPDPGSTVSDDELSELSYRIGRLFAREEFPIKFLALKRWKLIKGDALLMIAADGSKEEGSRLRILEVQPEQYFPIYDPADGERVIGVYLASIVKSAEDEEIIQRIEYRKVLNDEQASEYGAPVGSIFYRLGFFELDGWDDREPDGELKPLDAPEWALPAEGAPDPFVGFALPTAITSIPVYHFRNNRRGGEPGRFGISEIQGLESILAGVIQNATDEDAAVALQGLGVYWTDSGTPRDAQGNEVDWEISPASMLQLEKDGKVGRLDGVGSVQPLQDHLEFLKGSARESNAVPDIAVGKVGAQAASSGVALRIEFMPVIAKNAEKEEELGSKLTHFLYDLLFMWFPAYEGYTPPTVQPNVLFGDPLPVDRKAVLDEILQMVTAKVVSIDWAQGELSRKLGYKFPADMLATLVAEQDQLMDSMGARVASDAAETNEALGA